MMPNNRLLWTHQTSCYARMLILLRIWQRSSHADKSCRSLERFIPHRCCLVCISEFVSEVLLHVLHLLGHHLPLQMWCGGLKSGRKLEVRISCCESEACLTSNRTNQADHMQRHSVLFWNEWRRKSNTLLEMKTFPSDQNIIGFSLNSERQLLHACKIRCWN